MSILKKTPNHWPKVGSGIHRSTGTHDACVINDGGDWREVVLFGSGSGSATARSSSNSIALKTKQLLCQDEKQPLYRNGLLG